MAHNEYNSMKMRESGYSETDIALSSMKRTPKEKTKAYEAEAVPDSMDEYPYGLKIRLDTETLDKLGIKELKDVGDHCYICAVGEVKSTEERTDEYSDGETKREMCIQITKMSVEDYTMDDEADDDSKD